MDRGFPFTYTLSDCNACSLLLSVTIAVLIAYRKSVPNFQNNPFA